VVPDGSPGTGPTKGKGMDEGRVRPLVGAKPLLFPLLFPSLFSLLELQFRVLEDEEQPEARRPTSSEQI